MKKLLIYLVLNLFVQTLFSGCQSKHDVQLEIIQTTDVHGTIFPFDFIENKPIDHSLAQVSTFVNQERKNLPQGVVLLDNGDFLQGQPTVYYYNFEDTTGTHLSAAVMNYMKYDASTVGNHDIETGHAVYDKIRKQFNFPWLAANAVSAETGEPYFKPYALIERQGIRIAVLGLITPGIPDWLPQNLWKGMQFDDMVESAKRWVAVIQEKEHPDLIIGMFHSGVDYEYGNKEADTYKNENASKLVAEQVPGFDLILAGHDHKKYNEKVVNVNGDTVILLDPQSHARAVAVAKIAFRYNKQTKKYDHTIQGAIEPMATYQPDEQFLETFKKNYQAISDYVDQPIGEFTSSMSTKSAYFGNCPFMDLIQTVQLETSGADVSFAAPLSFNTSIEKGPVYVRDMFKLYKFENMLYTMTLRGNEIDKYLEYSTGLWFNRMKSMNDHLLKVYDDSGTMKLTNKYYNFSSASGIDYIINVSKREGDQVKILGFSDGRRFYSDSTYHVAMNSYRANGGGGHLTQGVGLTKDEMAKRFVKSTDKDLRYYLMKYIEANKVLNPIERKNWRIIPEDYYEKAKMRDYDALFGKEADQD